MSMTPQSYAAFVDGALDVLWSADVDGRCTYVNAADEKIRGFPAHEVLGQHILTGIDTADAVPLRSQLEALVADAARPALRFEARHRRKDGSAVWLETQVMVARDAQGAVTELRGISRDVSDRRRIEEQLIASRADLTYERDLFQSLLDSSPDDIYFKDLQSRIVRMSRAKALMLLRSVPTLRERRAQQPDADPMTLVHGVTDFDTYAKEDAQRAFDNEQAIIKTRQPLLNKVERQVFQDGTEVWFISDKFPWLNKAGEIIGTFGVSKNITELKRAEQALESMTKELVAASRLAGMAEVATGVLHNVGNAVNSVNVSVSMAVERIRGSHVPNLAKVADMLETHDGDLSAFLAAEGRAKKIVQYLRANSDAMRAEHAALLQELSEIRHGVDHIKEIVATQQAYATTAGLVEKVKVRDVVEDAIRMNASAFTRHGVGVFRQFESDAEIATDRHKVLQILVNLLRNAKYACDQCPEVEKRIVVGITTVDGDVSISVSDTGVGIPSDLLPKIFRHGFTTRKDGHGFGLHSGALCARELGGSLSVQSEGQNKGATFTLRLPLAVGQARELA